MRIGCGGDSTQVLWRWTNAGRSGRCFAGSKTMGWESSGEEDMMVVESRESTGPESFTIYFIYIMNCV